MGADIDLRRDGPGAVIAGSLTHDFQSAIESIATMMLAILDKALFAVDVLI